MTPNALILLFIAVFALIAAINVQSGWLFLVGYSLISLILCSFILGKMRLKDLSPRAHSSGVSERGEKMELFVYLDNLRAPLIACMAPPVGRRARRRFFFSSLVPEGWTFAVAEGPQLSLEIETPRRGEFDLPDLILLSSPLFLWASAKKFPGRGKVLVLPRADRLLALPWLYANSGQEDGIPRHQLGDLFRTVREYRSGDSLHRVHWKSTAKRGELMIKETESDQGGTSVSLVIDPACREGNLEVVEQVFSVTASIAAHLHRNGVEVNIFSSQGEAPKGMEEQLRWMARMIPDQKLPPSIENAVLITGRSGKETNFTLHCGVQPGGDIHCPPGCDLARALG